MAAQNDNIMTSLGDILERFGSGMARLDWKSMSSTFGEFWELLQQLTTASEESIVVRHKAYNAVFQVKNSLQDILDESATCRSTHRQSFDIFDRMESLIRFEQMTLHQFLSEHGLSKYRALFEAGEILYAGELLDTHDIDAVFKDHMKPAPFGRMKKTILKMRNYRDYIENRLEDDMKAMETKFEASSEVIRKKLTSFMQILEPVIAELVQVIEDETKKLLIITGAAILAAAVVGLVIIGPAIGYLFFGIKDLIAAFSAGTCVAEPTAAAAIGGTAVVGALGGYQIYKVRKDQQEHLDQLEDTYNMVTSWQQAIQEQFLCFRQLVATFKTLFEELSRNHEQYKDQQSDLEQIFGRTKEILGNAISQTDTFEKLVTALRDKEVERDVGF